MVKRLSSKNRKGNYEKLSMDASVELLFALLLLLPPKVMVEDKFKVEDLLNANIYEIAGS